MNYSKKITLSGLFVAIAVIMSGLHMQIGVAKIFPIQHMVNLVSAILLGPVYAVMIAFVTSFIRVSIGMGSLLAFPGSMIGAFLAGIFYQKKKNLLFAFLGEIIGTGIIGAIVAYPVAAVLMSKEVALFAFIIPFSLSSIAGASIGLIGLIALRKTGLIKNVEREDI